MIKICCENLMLYTLKDCLGHFRNLCQYTDRDKLEHVLLDFQRKADDLLKNCIKDFGVDKISKVFAEDLEDQVDEDPEQLLFVSICEIETIEAREKIFPQINFAIEVFKTILDVIRQNSKLLDLYNNTAIICFNYIV